MNASADVQVQWNVGIPLRDGTQLSAIVYLPRTRASAAPAIFAMTPYIAQRHHDRAMYFASHGYPFLSVDVRGRGNSEGTFHPLNEAQDGYDLVEWLAQQPYCNGKVAMWGGSYLGYCQWAVARERPPHLSTIVPVASAFYGVDVPLRNNVFASYTVQWLTVISGRTSQEKIFADHSFWSSTFRECFESGIAFKELDSLAGNPAALFQEWLSHPERDDYWDRYNPTADQYSRLSLPILTITGAYDGDQPGALAHYRQHWQSASPEERARHYLVIGPWDHSGTSVPRTEFCGLKLGGASLVDLSNLHLEWYAWTLQGGPKPQLLQKNVAYYVMGTEKWRYAETLEEITARSHPFYLQSTGNPTDLFQSGSLSLEPPGHSEPDRYVYDPRDVSLAELESTVDSESLVDQRMVHAAFGKRLIYHSSPFAEDTEISGFFRLSAWLAIDQPDTDFRAAIYEVDLDGGAIQLTVDWMRARYRESLRKARLIDAQGPLRYDFEHFTFVSRQIRKGHRLRLVVGPIDSIHWQKNYNSGGVVSKESMKDARPVTVRLYHDESHPTALYVPFGQADE